MVFRGQSKSDNNHSKNNANNNNYVNNYSFPNKININKEY